MFFLYSKTIVIIEYFIKFGIKLKKSAYWDKRNKIDFRLE